MPPHRAPAPRHGVFATRQDQAQARRHAALLEALRSDPDVLLVETDASGRVRAIVRRPSADSEVSILTVPES